MLAALVGRVTTELFVLQNRGCKVNEMPLTASVPPTMTLLSALVLRWDTGSGVCWAVRGTQWMYYSERATHHVERGCVQWKSIMLWCIDMHHLDSWQVSEDGLEAETLGFVWFSVTSIRDEARFMWSVPTGDDGTHESTMTAHRHRYLASATYKDGLSLSVCRCCSQTKIRSALNNAK